MKKILYSLAFASMLLCSCGGGSSSSSESNTEEAPKEHILKAAQTEIKGDLKGCYELVDKNYKVKFAKKSYESDVVTVELKRISKDLPYDRKNVVIFPEGKESSAEFCAGFGIEILDENGDVIEKQNANSNPYSWDEMTAALQLLEDETTTIAFHMEDLSKAVSFRILSIVQPNEERKTAMGSLVDAAKSAAEISDADVEDAEKAMKVAGEAMDAATKMLDALGGLK